MIKKLHHILHIIHLEWGCWYTQAGILSNYYENGGLRIFDPFLFSQAKKITWVKHLLDPDYSSFWKHFHPDWTILFISDAPECVLNTLCNCQLPESIKL